MPENEIQRKLLNGNDKIIAAINEKEKKGTSKTLMKIERDFFSISHFTPVHYTNFVHWIVWDDLGSYPQYLV